jgi:hypothetical protein
VWRSLCHPTTQLLALAGTVHCRTSCLVAVNASSDEDDEIEEEDDDIEEEEEDFSEQEESEVERENESEASAGLDEKEVEEDQEVGSFTPTKRTKCNKMITSNTEKG